ncbi:MAG: hypothetical protein R3C44_19370 [Chloroflexota bacterium]
MADIIKELKDSEKETIVIEPTGSDSIEKPRGKQSDSHNNAWLAGVVLVGIGLFFLLSNLTDFHINNWWALFILIPAFSSLGNAVRVYQRDERLGAEGRGSFAGGLILLFVAAVFLLGWSWGAIWPVFLVIGGVSMLLNAFLD